MLHICNGNNKSSLTNVEEKDIQPNAVDLKVDKILKINNSLFSIDENKKQHRGTVELQPDINGYWLLEPGVYEIIMKNIITIGEGESGWVITRSTLNRNGVFITSGLYDSGYSGAMAGALHVNGGPVSIKRGTRVGQFLLFKSETHHLYDGDYGLNANGLPKEMEQKYHN